jgi:signal transduction histidine kinase/ligand-binding sensor domain-containing protein
MIGSFTDAAMRFVWVLLMRTEDEAIDAMILSAKRMFKRSLGIAALGAFFAAGVVADSPQEFQEFSGQHVFRTYAAELGLLNTGVQQLVQDRDGFLWVGTHDGLYRFDGYRFDAFGLREGLASTAINSLNVDTKGVLWVGTHAGLSRWNGRSFDPVTTAQGLPGMAIASIADGADGLWVASALGPFVRDRNDRFHSVAGWPGGEATALWSDPHSKRVWVAQWSSDASVLLFQDNIWHRIEGPAAHTKERIDALAADDSGVLWARTASALWSLRPGALNFEAVATPLPLTSTKGFLHVGARGDVWVSSDQGLMRRNGERWHVIGPKQGLPAAPLPILEDRDGSIWIGSYGLQRLLGRGIFESYTKAEGLPYDVVWSVFRDREQQLWVGTGRGVAMLTATGFKTLAGTEGNTIRSIVQGSDGRLYMSGAPGNEILIYDPVRKTLLREEVHADNGAQRIFRMLLDRDGILWASTDGAGMFSADTHTEKLHFERVDLPNGTPLEYISDVRQDASGRIWAAGQRGLAMRENGRWRRFTSADGLRRDSVAYALPTSDGDLLVAYFDPLGIARVRYENGVFTVMDHLDSKATHSADKVFIVGRDSQQRTWIGGGSGIDLVSSSGTEHFGAAEGLIGVDTCAMAFLAESNGDVWFGTNKGLVRFNAAAYAALAPLAPPSLNFISLRLGAAEYQSSDTGVEVNHEANTFDAHFSAMSFSGDGNVQYRAQLHGLEADFHITDNRDARYSSLPYGQYRFEVSARNGQHGPWGPSTAFGFTVLPAWWQSWWFKTLVALAAAALLLLFVRWRVQALQRRNRILEGAIAARTGELSRANASLGETNTMLQSEIGDRLAAEQALQHRNAELVSLNEQLAGAQSQLIQSEKMASVGQLAAGVAHEINNPIGYVKANLCALKRYMGNVYSVLDRYALLEQALPTEHPDRIDMAALKARVELDYLRQDVPQLLEEADEGVARVQKIVHDLRDFSRLDEHEWQWADLHQGLESTLSIVAHEIKYKAELVREYGELPPIECLPSQLNQVFLNLLVNAAQAIEGRGRITIRTGVDANGVWVQVADTGQGIDAANLSRVFEPFFTTKPVGSGTGLGLSVSYGIVRTHGGTIEVASERGVGTQFTVHLPIARSIEAPLP